MSRRELEAPMRIAMAAAAIAALLGTASLGAAAPGGDAFVTEIWGDAPPCHHSGALQVEGRIVLIREAGGDR